METLKAEEIARAIWQRQHTALPAAQLSSHMQWRDESIQLRFWNEFLLDAHAVLLLLQEKHNDYRNVRQIMKIENPVASSSPCAALRCVHQSEADLVTVMQRGD